MRINITYKNKRPLLGFMLYKALSSKEVWAWCETRVAFLSLYFDFNNYEKRVTISRDTAVAKLTYACSIYWWYLGSNGTYPISTQ